MSFNLIVKPLLKWGIKNAPQLLDTLGNALFTKASSTPALAPAMQQDQRYLDALQVYQQQLEQVNRAQAQQSQAQREFNKRLLELLAEWHTKTNNAKHDELQMRWDKDNWFSRLDRQETAQILGQSNHRLLILVAPSNISSDCPVSLQNNLNKEIDNHTRLFVNQYYAQNEFCPVEFYGDYFKQSIAAADVRRLQSVLGSIPTAVLYTDITDYQVYFHIGFWGLQGTLTQFDMEPWNWEKAYIDLQSEGLNETQALRKIRQIIVEFHKLLAAFVTDWYYLNLNLAYKPQLFRSEIAFDNLPQEIVEQYISVLWDLKHQHEEAFEREEQLRATKKAAEKEKKKEQQKQKTDDGNLQGSGVHYGVLRNLLAAQKWKEADEETYLLMRGVICYRGTWIDGATLRHFPKRDLQKIDQLWMKYSNGHFGFSVQKEIWQDSRFRAEFMQRVDFSGSGSNGVDYKKYGGKVFNLSSPRGALPCKIFLDLDFANLYDLL